MALLAKCFGLYIIYLFQGLSNLHESRQRLEVPHVYAFKQGKNLIARCLYANNSKRKHNLILLFFCLSKWLLLVLFCISFLSCLCFYLSPIDELHVVIKFFLQPFAYTIYLFFLNIFTNNYKINKPDFIT